MSVMISVATSADGYIDDSSSERLTLSSAEDWAEVYELRALCDAIVIGGNTLRNDNSTLTLKSEELKAKRVATGTTAEPARVIISGRGEISPEMRIFSRGEGRIIIFSNIERAELESFAEVIVCKDITAAYIVTELERRGLCTIFVEGGEQIHKLFFDAHLVDKLRVAINPDIIVNDPAAPRFTLPHWISQEGVARRNLGGVYVDNYVINKGLTPDDQRFMEQAIEHSLASPKSEGCYSVGAVIVTESGEIFKGYTGENNPLYHAEQAAINKAIEAGAGLKGATIYATMEPCSQRSRQPKSCSQLILEHGFSRVCFALYEPLCFVACKGARALREEGVRVEYMKSYKEQVEAVNAHLLK